MCPEFVEEAKDGPGADMWSLGCIIFFMLTGKDPFPITTREKLLESIMSGVFLK